MVAEFRSRSDVDGRARHRGDLTGLRALAVVPLLLGAAGVGVVPGGFVGVDVLFVLSGFLVTGSLLAEWDRAGQISLLGFYAHRARQLLPAAMLVLAVTLPLALLCLPRERWAATGWDLLASGLLVQNWRLAEQGVGGYPPDGTASLLGHYWALGVAGQLLLLWPAVLVGIAVWAVRRGGPGATTRAARRPLLLTVAVLATGSFAWSAYRTGTNPDQAFLGTGSRLWELALGAALALLGARLARLPRRVGVVLGWAGVAAVAIAVLALRPGPHFPGYPALLPALGTAAIIVGGITGRRAAEHPAAEHPAAEHPAVEHPAVEHPATGRPATGGPADDIGTAGGPLDEPPSPAGPEVRPTVGIGSTTPDPGNGHPGTAAIGPARLLAAGPLRAVGDLCYPLYLWHWPLLVAAHAAFGELHPAGGLAVLGCAVLLAFLTHRYVETPIQAGVPLSWPPAQVLRIGALFPATAVVAGLLFQLTVWPPAQPTPPPAAAPVPVLATPTPPQAPGAAVLGRAPRESRAGVPVDQVRSITPTPDDAAMDVPDVYRHNCFPAGSSGTAQACVYGDRESDFTLALAGDSHAASWVPALQDIAMAKRWRLVTYLKPNCPFLKLPVAGADGRTVAACAEWYDNVVAELTGPERPDLLLTTSSRYLAGRDGRALAGREAHQALVQGMRRTWSGLTSARVPTAVLRDIPILGADSAECVAANPKRLTRCATPSASALAGSAGPAQAEATEELDEVTLIDLNGAICPAERCAAVIGGVLVYRDNRHLTATYARTLAPRLRSALDRILPATP